MMTKQQLLQKYPEFVEGMKVYSRDDESLGKVTATDEDYFTIQKGIFFPKDFYARYGDIADIRDGSLYLSLNRDELADWKNEAYPGWQQTEQINTGRLEAMPRPEYRERYAESGLSSRQTAAGTTEETRVPLMEEQLEARKTMHETGAVRLRKVVHTEFRHFTVPVTKEEVHIERVPATGAHELETEGAGAFQESTTSIPVREEEVEIRKRPVVKEEVRVSKEQRQEQREVSGEVRSEEIQIQEEGKAEKKKPAA